MSSTEMNKTLGLLPASAARPVELIDAKDTLPIVASAAHNSVGQRRIRATRRRIRFMTGLQAGGMRLGAIAAILKTSRVKCESLLGLQPILSVVGDSREAQPLVAGDRAMVVGPD